MSFLRHHYLALFCNLTAIGGATYYLQKEIAEWQCFAMSEQEEQIEKLEQSIKDHLMGSQNQYMPKVVSYSSFQNTVPLFFSAFVVSHGSSL